MARSKNPFPKQFFAWLILYESDPVLVECSCENGWYTVRNADTRRKALFNAKRWYDLQRLIDRGTLCILSTEPVEDTFESMDELL